MTGLKQKDISLLDKLYNLKDSEKNTIIVDLKERISNTENEIANSNKERQQNEFEESDLKTKLEIFTNQSEAFCSTFGELNNDTFQSLKDIGIDLEIGTILETIKEKAPEYSKELSEKIEKIQENIDLSLDEIQKLENNKTKLEEKLENAYNDAANLAGLLEQSLSSDESEREALSTKYVKGVISKFNLFSEDEITTLAKLLMFPDDGLYEYDIDYEDRVKNNFPNTFDKNDEYVEEKEVEVHEEVETSTEAEEQPAEEKPEEVKPVIEPKESTQILPVIETDDYDKYFTNPLDSNASAKENDIEKVDAAYDFTNKEENSETNDLFTKPEEDSNNDDLFSILNIANEPETKEEPEEAKEPEKSEVTDETIREDEGIIEEINKQINSEEEKETSEPIETDEEYLNKIGLDINKLEANNTMPISELISKIKLVSPKEIDENYELLRSLNINDNVSYKLQDNYLPLIDEELNKKITLLRAKGISEYKIKEIIENTNIFTNSYTIIDDRISAMDSIGEKVNDENIGMIQNNIVRYAQNLELLNNSGYELDDKEKANNMPLLLESKNIAEDAEILKNYYISILRKNGKYALNVFWRAPRDLMFGIDDIIEEGLEDIFTTNPEVLSFETDPLLGRIRFLKEKGESIYDDEGQTVFKKALVDFKEFQDIYQTDIQSYIPSNREKINHLLPSLIGDEEFVESLINTLDEYYGKTTTFKDLELTNEAASIKNDLLNEIEEQLQVTIAGQHTYKISDISISKNKIERNLSLLVDMLVSHNQPVVGKEKEILLVSLLYNLRQNEDTISKIIAISNGDDNNVRGGSR